MTDERREPHSYKAGGTVYVARINHSGGAVKVESTTVEAAGKMLRLADRLGSLGCRSVVRPGEVSPTPAGAIEALVRELQALKDMREHEIAKLLGLIQVALTALDPEALRAFRESANPGGPPR